MSHVKFGTLCIAYLKFKFTWGIFNLETLSGPQNLSSRDLTPLITCHSHPTWECLGCFAPPCKVGDNTFGVTWWDLNKTLWGCPLGRCPWRGKSLEAKRSGMVMIWVPGDPVLQNQDLPTQQDPWSWRREEPGVFLISKVQTRPSISSLVFLGRKLYLQWEMRSAGWREELPGSLSNPIIYVSLNPIKLATYYIKMAKEGLCQAC